MQTIFVDLFGDVVKTRLFGMGLGDDVKPVVEYLRTITGGTIASLLDVSIEDLGDDLKLTPVQKRTVIRYLKG